MYWICNDNPIQQYQILIFSDNNLVGKTPTEDSKEKSTTDSVSY